MNLKRCLWPLICPICFLPLDETLAMLTCPRGHTFDVSREGYVNPLLRYGKAHKIQGNAKPMLRAWRRFLEAGLLNIQQQKRQHIIAQSAGHFALDSIHPLTFELRLAAGGLLELAQMTPN